MQPLTPGVYTIEQNAFSNSVVGVDTAVPAFVGYTEMATYDGKKLTDIPTKVESFKQFQDYFGGGFLQTFELNGIDTTKATQLATDNEVFAVPPSPVLISPSKADYDFNLTLTAGKTPYYLYNAVRLFYLNGGATCYIVSVGDYKATLDYKKLNNGIDLLKYEQDPTMLLCPDALRLDSDNYNTVVQHMLMHCEEMQSRVALFDVYKGAVTKPDDMDTRISNFRDGVGQNSLKYGIAYFPWVHTSLLSDTEVSFLNLTESALGTLRELLNKPLPDDTQGAAAPGSASNAGPTAAQIVAAAADKAATDADAVPIDAKAAADAPTDATGTAKAAQAIDANASATGAALNAAGASMATPTQAPATPAPAASDTTVKLTNATAETLSQAIAAKGFTATARQTAQQDVATKQKALDDANTAISNTAAQLLNAYNALQQGDATAPALRQALSDTQDAADGARDQATTAAGALAMAQQHLAKAIAADDAAAKIIETAKAGIAAGSLPPKPAAADSNGKPYRVPALPTAPPVAGKAMAPGKLVNIFDQAIELLQDTAMNNAVADPTQTAQIAKLLKDKRDAINNSLLKLFPAYKTLMTVLLRYLNTMPVAPAMAGVYTAVDTGRGVWKAPANVSLTAVVAPTVSLSDQKQEKLNVDAVTGKSINAIRNFKGLGVMVWGARTLDGNSKDWRFINVRRTMIFIEQSVKLACRSYVFEPNDANTWTNVKSMINSFLFNLWKEGALAGAVPTDAYSVAVGLGSTMTADDILEGLMNVTVQVAIVRPAEFIMLTFQQQQQKS